MTLFPDVLIVKGPDMIEAMVKVRKGPHPPLPTLGTGIHEVGCLRAHLPTSTAFLSKLKEENGECTVYVYLSALHFSFPPCS